ncbi:putative nucleic acid-binding protein [Rhizobium sp. BIGb0125]|uniref:type II toxin-antitoxin system VapC family toxin n=1 Tax=Rhizobium sp. BIGb0125 TaxID=2940618 RepID=UPI002167B42E|nr:type II toxin-antitoxin system VapC family toxin [Rhizobium sp. BIGb0125]MCS4243137.1 putative nucleic acid-binding protein [Rhizobium sp. BIGb0125]
MGANSLALSFPAIAELRRGAYLSSKTDPQKAMRLHDWIDDLLSVDFQFAQLTSKASDLYAQMTTVGPLRHLYMTSPGQKKDKIGHDLLFAALSITHQMPIASFNARDFVLIDKYFPLPGVFDPLNALWSVPYHIANNSNVPGISPPLLPELVSAGFGFMR